MPFHNDVEPGDPASASARLRVDVSAIPTMRRAMHDALDRLGVQIGHAITDLRIRPWAGDPVSDSAANTFNDATLDGPEAALAALCGYRDQLQAAVDSLERAERQYGLIEDDNARKWATNC